MTAGRSRLSSFRHAFSGLASLVRTQPNARIHVVAAVLVCIAGLAFGISPAEWCWLTLAGALVLTAEAMNTAVEALADAAVPESHPLVKRAKDTAAAGVLIAAVGAVVIGLLVLGPHVIAAGLTR